MQFWILGFVIIILEIPKKRMKGAFQNGDTAD